jgi:hypothetical protein
MSDGTYDDYDSKVDALKAHHCALNVAAQLDTSWAGFLVNTES